MPKKYRKVQDVRLKDIYEAFPDCEQYHLRFEQVIAMANRKQTRVWVDFNKMQDISVPNVEGRIRVKALKMPKGVKAKVVAAPKP